MNEISCDICKDLIPLVQDGIASEDSAQAVEIHTEHCAECRALLEGKYIPQPDGKKIWRQLQRKLRIFAAMGLMFFLLFGLSLTAGSDLFYNSLIMPLTGMIGYYMFRWKAIVTVPLLLLFLHVITNFFGVFCGDEILEVSEILIWSGIYAMFAEIGVIIAGLLHFAFRKETIEAQEASGKEQL